MTPFSRLAAGATLAIAVALASGHLSAADARDPITQWSLAASDAAAAEKMPPLRTPITLALVHLAMNDAVTAVLDGRAAYAAAPSVVHPASAHAAAIEAGYQVLVAEFPGQRQTLDATYHTLLAEIQDAAAKRNGLAVGAAVSQAWLALRATDGRNANRAHQSGSDPGTWVPTPPGFLAANTAFLAGVTPFTMDSASQFRPSGPIAMSTRRWAEEYTEVKVLGAKTSPARTAEQTASALFWEPLAGTVWPASIRGLAREQRLDLGRSARFQASAFAAFADALIACWDAKFFFNFWRPITAIRNADADGNDNTDRNPAWEPLSVTPNFPEYPSGHACATAAVAHVIEDSFPNGILIPARNVVTGEERVYRKASDVVAEVIEARMMIGVHFRSSNDDGAEIGRRIARQIRARGLKPRR